MNSYAQTESEVYEVDYYTQEKTTVELQKEITELREEVVEMKNDLKDEIRDIDDGACIFLLIIILIFK